MINSPLTLANIKNEVDKLKSEYSFDFFGVKFIKSDILKDTQVIIRSGSDTYYSSDIKSGDVKLISLPKFEI